MGLYDRWRSLPEEVRFLGRIAVYALAIGTIYWFISYEVAGTAMLIGFGIATGVGFLVLWRGAASRDASAPDAGAATAALADTAVDAGTAAGAQPADPPGSRRRAAVSAATAEAEMPLPDGPFGDESGAIPGNSLVPLAVGFGAAVVGLGLVFGPWLILAGLVPFLAGAWSWLSAAGQEIER